MANISITEYYMCIQPIYHWNHIILGFFSGTLMLFKYILAENCIFQIRLNSVFWVGRDPIYYGI